MPAAHEPPRKAKPEVSNCEASFSVPWTGGPYSANSLWLTDCYFANTGRWSVVFSILFYLCIKIKRVLLTIYVKWNTESLTTDRNYTGGLTGGAQYSPVLLQRKHLKHLIVVMEIQFIWFTTVEVEFSTTYISPITSLFHRPSALTIISRRHQCPSGLSIVCLKPESNDQFQLGFTQRIFFPRVLLEQCASILWSVVWLSPLQVDQTAKMYPWYHYHSNTNQM